MADVLDASLASLASSELGLKTLPFPPRPTWVALLLSRRVTLALS